MVQFASSLVRDADCVGTQLQSMAENVVNEPRRDTRTKAILVVVTK